MKIFITGGTGTWGQAIVRGLLENNNIEKIFIFSRNEENQVLMEKKFNNKKLVFILGDIRNKELLEKNLINIDFVIHLAALKHIYKAEQNNDEVIDVNIKGTQNIIDVSIKNKVKKVLFVSTDKAVEPYNLYGNTKAIGEKLFINANNYLYNKNTIFYSIRTGNILGSNGSIVKIFYEQIINNRDLSITNYNFNRFYISIEDIVNLIKYSFEIANGGEIFILGGEIFSVNDILNAMLKLYGNGKNNIKEIGAYRGEKKDEVLISKCEIDKTYYIDNGKYLLIDNLGNFNGRKEKVDFEEYSTKQIKNKDLDKLELMIENIFNKK